MTFVYDVLFPFARAEIRAFLEAHSAEEAVRADLEALRQEHAREPTGPAGAPAWHDAPPAAWLEGAVGYVHWLMDRDRKSTALKSLQGRVWEVGYRTGSLRGVLYPDVAPALERWRDQGRTAAIFSSGSVLAQKLLFAHSTAGDLTPLLAGFFDTTAGPKREAASYRKIAAGLGADPGDVLFLSDVAAELDAAREAGMQTALCVREGEPDAADQAVVSADHAVVQSLDEVFPPAATA